MSKIQKKRQIRLNLQQKVDILRKLDDGIAGNRIALHYGVSKVAISKINKKRQEILKTVAATYESAEKKTLHKSEYPDLEVNLYNWFLNQRQRNCTVTGAILKSRAKLEFEILYPGKKFSASDGWLANFKKRHGIRLLKICGEILSSDTPKITPFVHSLRAKINEMDDLPLSKFIKANDVYDDTVREVQSLMLKVGNNLNISIDDIENWNKDEITEDMEHFEVCDSDNDDSITEEDIQQPKVSFSKAVESINTLIKWSKDNNDANQVADLISMRTKMVKNYYTKEKKQTTLDCFFKPTGTN
ncbi:jerky protein homolog-like [Teleopsis dalmanni]|uniref:jerky protein homolog-like n=1 Tax=Teleopsis dalmanni TaxID=139649 RepID=UPI0018CEE9DC|nr:jerky protein homolog-like [Teleopsis dalmanni]XP_037930590.1 jerky protein homolog-like [Teleopsis dalmanni]